MFHPVGSQPPSVYWRRRIVLLASVIALVTLIALTVRALLSDAPGTAKAAGSAGASSPPSHSSGPSPPGTTKQVATSAAASRRPSSSRSRNESTSPSAPASSAAPKACKVAALALAAASDRPKYAVGDQPVFSILVTNNSGAPCVQDLGDPQIVLRVYNGESRVWGSHDCKIVPGTDDRTLSGKSAVRVSVAWAGLSSQPKCAGTRQRAGAGTYTLYASLAGREGKAAQFTIS